VEFETFAAPEGERLDTAMADALGISRTLAKELVQGGYAQVNGVPAAKPASRLAGGEIVSVMMPDMELARIQAEDIPVSVFHEDADLLAVNKPPRMTVHPTASARSGTLVNALMGRYPLSRESRFSVTDEEYRPGIVHRLDRDTSGVMLVARNDEAHLALARAFKQRIAIKNYIAIAAGELGDDTRIEAPIGRHPVKRQQMTVGGLNPKQASSTVHVLGRAAGHSLVDIRLHTGRTHQIRVHLAHLHAPVLGDAVYGKPSPLIDRQALHAYSLIVPHPHDRQAVTFTAAVPADIRDAWLALGGTWPAGIETEG